MITLLDYQAGNLHSLQNAIERLGYSVQCSSNPEQLCQAEKVIVPGVGHAAPAMAFLKENGLDRVIRELTCPVLGICLGMQLLTEFTEEGQVIGLGVFDVAVKKLSGHLKIPHMGWNNVHYKPSKLFEGIPQEADFYFVHSYAATLGESTLATCEYGASFSVALAKNNFYGVQFHPEKSGKWGQQLLQNFLAL
ncbi:imidazole glycerol phosphate synthase subunit HisH [Flavobacterium sp.]|jgi:glutamine amidotransferase|uniref:imidazole glycerol phosphate synthase subunit HisH n=1 Tax=Flavobacterium sp. TaxID=239 RepID=UPI0022CBA35B|nr:imidazole glycerol phosphate synthase subunit HisH [Flavobacterium sp.]MCZ8145927.1 imidazole glycerol phosphate synthase subunit HisH [Flavobacterium sp.]MCZ8366784.1 imidazole glycerol phosphate synthase subunit HisH [Flavobacterium sp.]